MIKRFSQKRPADDSSKTVNGSDSKRTASSNAKLDGNGSSMSHSLASNKKQGKGSAHTVGDKGKGKAIVSSTVDTASLSGESSSEDEFDFTLEKHHEEKKKNGRELSSNSTAPVSSIAAASAPARWLNKQRVLVLCSRGVTSRARHLMTDLRTLMPHSKKDVKLDKKDRLNMINEVCELKNCNNCVFIEMRKKQDMFLWLSKTPNGPSVKFHVENVNTMDELRMTGNSLKGSRPILSFDQTFDTQPHLTLLKELFIQIFGTPKGHPKSKPFVDRVQSFSIADDRVWVRNFQIIEQAGEKNAIETSLNEIGPRFVLNIVRIFDGSFGGATIYENSNYVSPNEVRAAFRKKTASKYETKVFSKETRQARSESLELSEDELDHVFDE